MVKVIIVTIRFHCNAQFGIVIQASRSSSTTIAVVPDGGGTSGCTYSIVCAINLLIISMVGVGIGKRWR